MTDKKEHVETLNIAPKWCNLLPLYADWYVQGNETQRELAEKEFKKISRILDGINDGTYELNKTDKELKEKGLMKDGN